MTSLLIVGMVLAFMGLIVYSIRGKLNAEKEMATSRETQKVALEKVENLERTALAEEKVTREKEAQEIHEAEKVALPEGHTRTTIGFYPTRMYPKKPDVN